MSIPMNHDGKSQLSVSEVFSRITDTVCGKLGEMIKHNEAVKARRRAQGEDDSTIAPDM